MCLRSPWIKSIIYLEVGRAMAGQREKQIGQLKLAFSGEEDGRDLWPIR
ncbi:MAG: hypothetical protein AAFO17_07330 [Pseudomonadota bacterium]